MYKKTLITILGITIAFVGLQAQAEAQKVKIGYVDLQRTLNETKVGKAARKRLEVDKKKKQKALDKSQKDLQKSAKELEKQRTILKPAVLRKREAELQQKYVKLQETYMQLQQDLAKHEAKLVREIFTKASPVIQKIAKEKGYGMVLEKNESAVLYSDPSLDITDEVNKRLK